MSAVIQSRRLKMHPAMLFDVIQRQAGTLGKAVLEGVMNCADAGGTRCDITLTETSYQIVDDGKGFRGQDEIDAFFETFGTPHAEGDATFGRFRMGRGQGFSFGVNHWQSGCFDMVVDIKGRGLDYDLTAHPEPIFSGCNINVSLYDRLSPGDYAATLREVRNLCEWMPIPTYLNGVRISKSIAEEQWDVETEDFVIKRKATGRIKLYNIGAFVREYSPYDFGGFNGVVISKKQLQVNFPRNDVLVSKCSIYKDIRAKLRELGGVERKQGKRLTNDDRAAMLREAFEGAELSKGFLNEKLIPVWPSRFIPMRRWYGTVKAIVISDHDDQRLADRLKASNRDGTLLLKAELLTWLGLDSDDFEGLALALEAIHGSAVSAAGTYHSRLSFNIIPFAQATKGMSLLYEAIPQAQQTKAESLALNAINQQCYELARLMRHAGIETQQRRCMLGSSTAALAWTDGRSKVTFDREYLRKNIRSLGGFQSVMSVLVHELLHTDSDEGSHIHDEDFYRAHHDLLIKSDVFSLALKAAVVFSRSLMRSDDLGARDVSAKLTREVNALFNLGTHDAQDDQGDDPMSLAA